MKYLLIMNSPRDGYTQYLNWPNKILEANAMRRCSYTGRRHRRRLVCRSETIS